MCVFACVCGTGSVVGMVRGLRRGVGYLLVWGVVACTWVVNCWTGWRGSVTMADGLGCADGCMQALAGRGMVPWRLDWEGGGAELVGMVVGAFGVARRGGCCWTWWWGWEGLGSVCGCGGA